MIMNFLFHFNSMLELLRGTKCIRIHYCNFIQNMIMSEIWCYSYTNKIGCIKKFRNSSAKPLHCSLFLGSLTSIAMNCSFGSEDSVCGQFGAKSTILLLVKCEEDMTSHLISLGSKRCWAKNVFAGKQNLSLNKAKKEKKNLSGESLEVREKARNVFLRWPYVCLITLKC